MTYVSFPGLGIDTFEMKRNVIENLFGTNLSIAWYGLLITVGIILACVVISYNATKKEGYELNSFLDYYLAAIPFSIVGARLMYVVFKWEEYAVFNASGAFSFFDTLKKVVSVWEGGLAVYGGVIFGAIAVFVVARIKKTNPLRAMDAAAPGLMLAQAIGRWGNFVNGEAYGSATTLPWGMKVAASAEGIAASELHHPTFFYESMWNLIGFILIMALFYRAGKKKFHGEIIGIYMIWYGVGRALVEGLRTDSLYLGPETWGIRISQVIGIVSALAGIALMAIASDKFRVAAKAGAAASSEADAAIAAEASEKAGETEKEKEETTPAGEEKEEPAKTPETEEKTEAETEEKTEPEKEN